VSGRYPHPRLLPQLRDGGQILGEVHMSARDLAAARTAQDKQRRAAAAAAEAVATG
jgi:hypothetical protein